VYFGTALGNFGVDHMLDGLVSWAPPPKGGGLTNRSVESTEDRFPVSFFKIQANMDPRHRDRIAFLRIVSGRYHQGMKIHHVRIADREGCAYR